jgi:hypothetical protein
MKSVRYGATYIPPFNMIPPEARARKIHFGIEMRLIGIWMFVVIVTGIFSSTDPGQVILRQGMDEVNLRTVKSVTSI